MPPAIAWHAPRASTDLPLDAAYTVPAGAQAEGRFVLAPGETRTLRPQPPRSAPRSLANPDSSGAFRRYRQDRAQDTGARATSPWEGFDRGSCHTPRVPHRRSPPQIRRRTQRTRARAARSPHSRPRRTRQGKTPFNSPWAQNRRSDSTTAHDYAKTSPPRARWYGTQPYS